MEDFFFIFFTITVFSDAYFRAQTQYIPRSPLDSPRRLSMCFTLQVFSQRLYLVKGRLPQSSDVPMAAEFLRVNQADYAAYERHSIPQE